MKWTGLTTLALATLTTVWAETSKKTATYNFGKFSGDYPAHMRPQNGLCNIIVQSKVSDTSVKVVKWDVTDKATQGGKLIGPFWDPRAQAIGAATVDGHRASVYPIEMEEGDAAQCPDA
ncbi:hypothetical protein QFC21_001887 [Naganishia friedmannii]|uniref:Uncharacterized protein n=1 Tax=Naganishia friedmannii TaxID=89922 RepID=A0ACC2W2C1_9TREE|nr:hypothetical protein QFC21_001887 [Naganishia friedmannii]